MQTENNNHVFTSGLKDAIDISKLKGNTWAFPTLNVRLLNKDGQGYIMSTLQGNTVNYGNDTIGGTDSVGAVFEVRDNYVIIGAKEFNGLLYIASAINTGTGQGEIGVYPAPISMIPLPAIYDAALVGGYDIGDTVLYSGVAYQCITATPDPPGAFDPTLWVAVFTPALTGWTTPNDTYPYGRFYAPLGNFNSTITNTAGVVSASTFDATAIYVVGDYVEYTDVGTNRTRIWVCHTGVGPAAWTGVANWTEVIDVYSPTYTVGYTVGQDVVYNNHTYICIENSDVPPGVFTAHLDHWSIYSSFNSTEFDFTFNNMLEIEIRPHYDNTVNLYLCDYTNPNRVINSGFDMTTGTLTDTVYDDSSFYSVLNQIMGTSKTLTVDSVEIVPTGAHRYGNYFFYLKYVNDSLDKTDVVCSTNACQMYDGDVATESTVQGGDPQETVYPYSGKKVLIQLDTATIDQSYSYIDVIYTRYYGDPSGVMLWETYEIVNQYLIDDILDAGGIIEIIGDEAVVNIDEAEILRIRGIENICKTQAQFGNRWWGGNWKGPTLHDHELTDFAKLIKISYYDDEHLYGTTDVMSGAPVVRTATVSPTDNANGQYDDYHKTYDYVGYFRGEPYVFGVVFELKTGQETEAYPLNGVDGYAGGVVAADYVVGSAKHGNVEGRYRFPNTENSSPYRGIVDGDTANNTLHILGVNFDTSLAVTYLATANWIKANVRGMYFVRMDRKETLKYQGITLPGSKSYLCYNDVNPIATPVEYTTGDLGTFMFSYNAPFGAPLKLTVCSGQGGDAYTTANYGGSYGADAETWLTATVSPCPGNEDDSFGQFVGRNAGAGDWFCNYWDAWWDGANQEAGVEDTWYRDIYYPIYRGYMPTVYYNNGVGWRYYMQRWFHNYGKQCFFSPDYFLDKTANLDSSYWVKHVARTQDYSFDNWQHLTQADYDSAYTGATMCTDDPRDTCPLPLMAEVITRYVCDNKLLDAEECDVFEIGRTGDITASGVGANKYVNAGCDFTGVGSYTGAADTLWRAYKTGLLGGNKQHWSNRSIRSQQYIGIDTALDVDPDDENYRLAIVNLHTVNPTPDWVTPGAFNLENWETSYYTKPLYKISDYIPLFDETTGTVSLDAAYVCYKGDCFLQRFYFKQAFFNCTNFTADGGDGVGTGSDAIACHHEDGTWPQFDDPETGVAPDDVRNRYAHGLIMGIVVEMKFNGNMRYKDGDPTYYPYTPVWEAGTTWSIAGADGLSGEESQLYNEGHHRILDVRPSYFYNSSLPHSENKHLTRIRYSDIHDQYSIIDGYRNILPLAYKDYDSSLQQIMKIVEFSNELLSVQEDSINRHYTLEKEIETDIASSTIALGSGDILSDKVRRIADYGTQHQWSVVKTKNAIYGVDSFRRLIWRAKMSTTTTGSYVMASEELNRSKLVEKWLYDWFDDVQPVTDFLGRIDDKPIIGYGVVGGYDAKYKDVIFSFFNHENDTYSYSILGIVKYNKKWDSTVDYLYDYQIVFNQYDSNWYYSKLPVGIISNVNHQPNLYPNYWVLVDFDSITNYVLGDQVVIGNFYRCCESSRTWDCDGGYLVLATELISGDRTCVKIRKTAGGRVNYNAINISCCEDKSRTLVFNEDIDEFVGETSYNSVIYANIYNDFFTGGNTALHQQSYAWKHDMPDCLWFYGGEEEMQISWYENGNTETATVSSYTKFFESQDVHSSEKEFYGVIYETEYQTGSQFPFTSDTEFWRSPEYLEHHWKVPIEVKADADDQDFETDSSMQGTWLKTTLRYMGFDSTYVKNVSTSYRISYV